ncbi:unnamed protein product, partial [Ilex paraguariensis]
FTYKSEEKVPILPKFDWDLFGEEKQQQPPNENEKQKQPLIENVEVPEPQQAQRQVTEDLKVYLRRKKDKTTSLPTCQSSSLTLGNFALPVSNSNPVDDSSTPDFHDIDLSIAPMI